MAVANNAYIGDAFIVENAEQDRRWCVIALIRNRLHKFWGASQNEAIAEATKEIQKVGATIVEWKASPE